MATTKTNKTAAKAAKPATETAPNTDQATSTNPATAAVASTPEPAASPTHQPAVDTPTAADKGDSDSQEPYVASLRPIQAGLTPLQHVTAIIAGGVVSGMLARTKPYEMLDLTKVAETIGMCAKLADLILDLEDNPEDIQSDD